MVIAFNAEKTFDSVGRDYLFIYFTYIWFCQQFYILDQEEQGRALFASSLCIGERSPCHCLAWPYEINSMHWEKQHKLSFFADGLLIKSQRFYRCFKILEFFEIQTQFSSERFPVKCCIRKGSI